MKHKNNEVDVLLKAKVSKQSKKLLDDYTASVEHIKACNDQFVKMITICRQKKLSETAVIINLAAFINIVSLDLKVILRDISQTTDEWCQRHYIRQTHLLMYEAQKTYYDMQKDFMYIIEKRPKVKPFEAERLEFVQLLREFNKSHNNLFYTTRNEVIAHRNPDVMKQIELIEKLSYSESLSSINKFSVILNKLGAYLNSIIKVELDQLFNR